MKNRVFQLNDKEGNSLGLLVGKYETSDLNLSLDWQEFLDRGNCNINSFVKERNDYFGTVVYNVVYITIITPTKREKDYKKWEQIKMNFDENRK